jgi:[ribosomal protein S5]-alanine N-acetyltransferase
MDMDMIVDSRFILRDLEEKDWIDIHKYASQATVCQYQPWGPNSEDDTKEFVKQVLKDAKVNPRTRYVFGIVIKEDNQLIGSVEFNISDQTNKTGEIGYIIHPDYWRKGIASEATKIVLNNCFKQFNLHRVFATCDVRNIASSKVLSKVGMTLEGKMRENLLLRDGWRDSFLYSILDHEWRQNLM